MAGSDEESERDLSDVHIDPESALARLIRDNQDYDILDPMERRDGLDIPLWLRVLWHKSHPDWRYQPENPTGGYPLLIREMHSWMLSHQDLKPEPRPEAIPPGSPTSNNTPLTLNTAPANVRISGNQPNPRTESDIRVNRSDPQKIIAASNSNGGSYQAQYYSTDHGLSWGQTTLALHLPEDDFHDDPSVGWTSDGIAWATTVGQNAHAASQKLRSYRSIDHGRTWNFDGTISGSQTQLDKPMMCVDDSTVSPYQDTIYVIWQAPVVGQEGWAAFVNRRTRDPSGAWQNPLQVSGPETTGSALGGDVQTNDHGDVFAFWPDTDSRNLFVAKSTDGGGSFAPPLKIATTFGSTWIGVPSFTGKRSALIYVSGGAHRTQSKDCVYAVWTDLNGATGCSVPQDAPEGNVHSSCTSRIWFARSQDGGATWSPAAMINNEASLSDQFQPRLAVDRANGQLVVIYYDTVADPTRLRADVWCQWSEDDGSSWSSPVKVTSAQLDETMSTEGGDQYGDYTGLSGYALDFFPSWTDRRNNTREEIWSAKVTIPPPASTGTVP